MQDEPPRHHGDGNGAEHGPDASAEDKQAFFPEPPRPLMRDMPPADPFPLDAMPDFLRRSIEAISDMTQTEPAIAAQSVLAVSTLATQPHIDVRLPHGGICPTSGFFITVAESGERKSSVNDRAYLPVRRREKELHDRYEIEHEIYVADLEAYKQAIQNAKSGGRGGSSRNRDAIRSDIIAVGKEPKKPMLPWLTSADPTVEGLIKNWPGSHPAQGIVASEGGQFLGGHGFTADAVLKTAAMLSTAWSGETIRRNRAGDGITNLDGRRLSIDLQCQPEVAVSFYSSATLRDQGLLARFLPVWPASRIGSRVIAKLKPETDQDYQTYLSRIGALLGLSYVTDEDSRGGLLTRELSFDPAAGQVWIAFANASEKQMLPGGEYETITGLASKLPEHAARLAAVIEVVSGPSPRELPGEISAASLVCAIKLAQHYAREALRMFAAGRVNPDLALARKVWAWIESGWSEKFISLPDIYQRGPTVEIREKNRAACIAGILTDHGYLHKMEKGAAVGGKKRRDAWAIWGRPL